jgi:flagellar P-ring protein precursor FlgI
VIPLLSRCFSGFRFALFGAAACLWLALPVSAAPSGPQVRIKDLCVVEGARSNQLVGMGLVVGLQGTGDKTDLAMRMMANVADNFGVKLDSKSIKSKNVAAVTVVCELPPFAAPGQGVDVLVSAVGDAKSLQGGVLLQTPLKGADGRVYAVAQGPLLLGGYAAGGQAGGGVSKNVTTTGRIPGGGMVEQAVPMDYAPGGRIALVLRQADFTTAQRVAEAVNARYGRVAQAVDGGRIEVTPPAGVSAGAFIAAMEGLTLRPDSVARVVINERTGTVVMGGHVTISPVAVAHGNLTVNVSERPEVVQPNALGAGRTAVVPRTGVQTQEGVGRVITLPATSNVDDLAKALNAVGATPRDLIPILQAIDQAGALHGQLVLQ